jgi:hypothetical protein
MVASFCLHRGYRELVDECEFKDALDDALIGSKKRVRYLSKCSISVGRTTQSKTF